MCWNSHFPFSTNSPSDHLLATLARYTTLGWIPTFKRFRKSAFAKYVQRSYACLYAYISVYTCSVVSTRQPMKGKRRKFAENILCHKTTSVANSKPTHHLVKKFRHLIFFKKLYAFYDQFCLTSTRLRSVLEPCGVETSGKVRLIGWHNINFCVPFARSTGFVSRQQITKYTKQSVHVSDYSTAYLNLLLKKYFSV